MSMERSLQTVSTEKMFDAEIDSLVQKIGEVSREVSRAIVGQQEVIEGVLIALMAGGHVLMEGAPGLGKTLLVRTLSETLAVTYSRIQFTPDLMPADVIGTSILREEAGRKSLEFQPGPIFANVVLADEINRATPRTQSALLEAMQESQVTIGRTTHTLEEPFFVMATQNPLEMEGTYPLPEAQLDRFFFKLQVPFPQKNDLSEILERTTGQDGDMRINPVLDRKCLKQLHNLVRMVPLAPHVKEYAVRLVLATHPQQAENALARKYIRYGSSPRGGQALILGARVRALLHGRFNASLEDISAVMLPALRHRLILNFEAQADSRTADDLIQEIAGAIPK
jgi:MoxR-like ATPase